MAFNYSSEYATRVPRRRRPLRLRQALLLSVCMASATWCQGFTPSGQPTRTTAQLSTPSTLISTMATSANRKTRCFMSSREQEPSRQRSNRRPAVDDNNIPALGQDYEEGRAAMEPNSNVDESTNWWNDLSRQFQTLPGGSKFKMPPMQVDDTNLLFYDVFLLVNLVVSISFWVVHRMQFEYIALAFNEGCLLSLLWIVAGLYHGVFLNSAMDGHQRPVSSEDGQQTSRKRWWEVSNKGGPSAAGLLALNTFVNTINLRLIVALVVAVVEHRPVFEDPLEQLIPLEVGFGLILMCCWRTIHSAFTPRI